ncbi:hypothetical protein HRG_004669 [Hirsutella rhossiliensis]|uniref:Uncharacterized protein n=1 Tax=Hirsutella rhossiliensis TaxID=111463 RepID=A0A9P8N1J7_9HYPO|nr:uncharacterized protein HRG_04669 [Hirsutella rhossiliensis]KAH0964241.1 hypothetical protein HRG_04669 [Hirsutella rhossiliensis]
MRCKYCNANFRGTPTPCLCRRDDGRQTPLQIEMALLSEATGTECQMGDTDMQMSATGRASLPRGRHNPPAPKASGKEALVPQPNPLGKMGTKFLYARGSYGKRLLSPSCGNLHAEAER